VELKHKDITEKIIGASFEVHSFLGNGFQEVIYQRALAFEMSKKGLSFSREIETAYLLQRIDRTDRNTSCRFFGRGQSTG